MVLFYLSLFMAIFNMKFQVKQKSLIAVNIAFHIIALMITNEAHS